MDPGRCTGVVGGAQRLQGHGTIAGGRKEGSERAAEAKQSRARGWKRDGEKPDKVSRSSSEGEEPQRYWTTHIQTAPHAQRQTSAVRLPVVVFVKLSAETIDDILCLMLLLFKLC